MIQHEVLVARALQYVVDEHKLTKESLLTIPGPLKIGRAHV